jgi:hypothetical protein
MDRWFGQVRSMSFQLRWVFMSSQERYAYLWARTKKLNESGYALRNTVVSAGK